MLTMTHQSLSRDLGQPVPEMYVIIAKNSILSLGTDQIAGLLGATEEEIVTIESDELYKNVRLLLAAEYARGLVDSDTGWDDLEQMALKKLGQRVPFETDSDFLLKLATLANRATRRIAVKESPTLDPVAAGTRVPLTLTQRIVTRLNAKTGDREVEETRQISLTDGTAKNPNFEDIDALLGVSQKPKIQDKMRIKTSEGDFTVEDLSLQYLMGAK